ncbi:deazaflavin-dependent oxidoreductase (nitroreductase family) [Nocardia tenerifensis]|uniref:Deazaflavin-dependent oxidoreductase (Nitroreductase family) n=1 Tax=Nocardia tenerifensis TaxID=228006 RepID=A0A318JUY0_9NOCA|nr:nitroreductase/quinone reductase family protein [Nocardia tenerifensis]PXX59263.1 deazaflavin-dependent oxidoreductase (nitroreductase family) [Nocardia tenerifensis]
MSDRTGATNPYGTPSTTGPEPVRTYQGTVNKIVRTVLRLPVISGVVGKKLLTLHIVGRKSGRAYDVPVAYTRHDGSLLIGTALRPWVKNLLAGEPVQASLGGKPRTFVPVVHTGEQEVMRLYEIIARENKTNAKFNGIGFTEDGSPNKADIYQTWQQGGVVVELKPR